MSAARSRPKGSTDLVELIRRAVASGNGRLTDVLLAVLEAVADDAMLTRLSRAMAPGTGAAGPAGTRAARPRTSPAKGPRADRPGPPAPRRRP